MECSICHKINRTGARFCQQCGRPFLPESVSISDFPVAPKTKPMVWVISGVGLLMLLFSCLALFFFFASSSGGLVTPTAIAITTGESAVTAVPNNSSHTTVPPGATSLPEPTSTPDFLRIPGTDIEIPRLTDEEETEIGYEIALEVEAEYGLYSNPAVQQRVEEIGQRIVPHADRSHLEFHFRVLDTAMINAYAVPGGFVYVTRGMLDFVNSDDELAGVIGHEIAHIGRRHGAQKIEAIVIAETAVRALVEQHPEVEDIYSTQEGKIVAELTTVLLFTGWSRRQEFEADEYGTIYMARAGYNPQAVISLFQRMQREFEIDEPGTAERLLRTHPPFSERIRHVEETIIVHDL